MKAILIAASAAAACLLSGCASEPLKESQKTERHVLADKQKSDRQVERAQKELAAATTLKVAAAANLIAKEQQQAKAEQVMQEEFCSTKVTF